MVRVFGIVAAVVCSPTLAATFTVTSTNDTAGATCAAVCTLRQALTAANNAAGPDVIAFNIPGAGPHRIVLTSSIGPINEVSIDGYTQSGAVPNSHAHASNAVLKVILDGRTLSSALLNLSASSVRGLSIIGNNANASLLLQNGTTIAGNWFGVEPDGTTTVSHLRSLGINSPSTHTVGGIAAADRNVFVAADTGVRFDSAAIGTNVVRNNLFGLLPDGSTPAALVTAITSIGNTGGQSALDNTISCTGPVAILSFGRVFERNRFGTRSDGLSHPGCTTGRLTAASGQSFAFNTFAFYAVSPLQVASNLSGIVMLSNRVIGGTAVPFDLNNNGFSFNDGDDSDTGANGLQNYPTITESRRIDDDNVQMAGQLQSTPNTSFKLEFFASPEITRSFSSAFPLANAERVSTGTVTVTTNAAGVASFGPVPIEFDGNGDLGAVVGTATRLDGNGIGIETSEYGEARAVYVQASGDFVVTNTATSGPGSLFRALLESEARPDGAGRDRVTFNIPGPGPHTIGLGILSVPVLSGKLEIDGYTQPGAVPNTATIGSNAQLKIDLLNVKLVFRNDDTLARGLVLRGPSGLLSIAGGALDGNFIGVSVDGTSIATTNENTSQIVCDGPCRIGGAALAERNVIGCPQQIAAMSCIAVRQFGSTGVARVEGNLIGVNASGTARLVMPNDTGASQIPTGIELSRNFAAVRNNVIGGLVNGIQATVAGNLTIEGNRIGIGADDLTPIGNARHGINLVNAQALITANAIAHNGRDAVLVSAGSNLVTLSNNVLHSNGELGIDLNISGAASQFGDGVSPNDLGDPDTFANGGQNFPELSNARRTATTVTADISLNSLPNRQYRIRYCYLASADPSGHGECEQPLAIVQSITTDASGNFVGTTPSLPATALGRLTATAGRVQGAFEDTSEFALAVPIADTASVALTATPNPSVFGQPITANVTVTGVLSTPTGSVTVTASNGGSCVATLTAGSGSCQLSAGGAGAITLTATYPGAPGFTSAESTTAHQVTRAPTTLAITSDTPDPSTFGDAITVAFQIQSTPTAAGTVSITDGVGGQCSGTLTAGAGSCVLTPGSGGALTLSAQYAETINFLASSDSEPHQVNAVASALTILSDTPDPSVFGQPVNVSAQLNSAIGQPAGPILISDGAGASCQIVGAAGNCNLIPTNAGDITLRADFAGDATHLASTASSAHNVARAATSLTPATPTALDGGPPRQFAPMRFPIAIAAIAPGSGAPSGGITVTGTVGVEVCVQTLPAASCDLVVQTPGIRTFQASYPGDSRFLPSSAEIVIEVRPDQLHRSGFEESD